jgi:hypothetical protein
MLESWNSRSKSTVSFKKYTFEDRDEETAEDSTYESPGSLEYTTSKNRRWGSGQGEVLPAVFSNLVRTPTST